MTISTQSSLLDLPAPGQLPERMLAAVVRPERYGRPDQAYQLEVVDVPPVGPSQALVLIMAAGVNYNGVWAALGKPVDVIAQRRLRGDTNDFHVGGSDGAGIVWAVGDSVRGCRVGDHVVLSGCCWDETAEDVRLGAEPVTSRSQVAWGYEQNFGSFAQFAVVDEYQCHPKPAHLTWEEAACFLVTGATAYRQLCGWPPHGVHPGDPVLIWGGAGGLGSMAIQIVRQLGGIPIAVVSSAERSAHCLEIGAAGVIDRSEFSHWGSAPPEDDARAFAAWTAGLRAFRERFADVLGSRRRPRIVLEHPGETTLPTSIYVCDNAGMVVTCGATTGYMPSLDLRHLWMRQKRLQGSHYASLPECRAITHLVGSGDVSSCLSLTLPFAEVGRAHQLMHENRHPPGQMAVLVNAPRVGTNVPPEPHSS